MSRLATVKSFLRIMGAIYAIAFVSFGVQAPGLVGSHGILPAGAFLGAVREALGARGYWYFPTVLWLRSGDWELTAVWIAGAILGLAALGGWVQRAALGGCWVLWLSICSVGQDFLSFQWDMLLLEAGFLSMFAGKTLLRVWLFRLLIFRLMFSSGVVKLASGDAVWRNLTAMSFHYETQPLPTPLGWWMFQLPGWFQRATTLLVFVVELVVPFLFLMPRRLRVIGAWITIGFQVLILLTGNYAYFNWLTIALCLWLFIEAERKVTWGG
ncbi:MAG TPA: lipase maturation factor family protein, partial [Candidatus Acidoferrales bacterium]|nr:lipase maturation factor family protein [Candidatus Acidoferrales bacterium]